MEKRFKELGELALKNNFPIEISLKDGKMISGENQSVSVQGSISFIPKKTEVKESSDEKTEEIESERDKTDIESGKLLLTCSDEKTGSVKLDGNQLILDIKKALFSKNWLKTWKIAVRILKK